MDEVIKTFKALSDETRLRMLNILTVKGCCVRDVMYALDISHTRASRKLGLLEDAGFLKSQKRGSRVYYFLNEEAAGNFMIGVARMMGELAARNSVMRLIP